MGIIATLLIDELRAKGYDFEDVSHLMHQNNPLPFEVSATILKWLPKLYEEHLASGDCVVRALISAGEPFDPTVLIDLFENSHYNESVKWSIAFVLSIAKTYNITPWLKTQLLAEPHAFERAGFLRGLEKKGGFQTKAELRSFLMEIFDKYAYYEYFQKLVQKYGSVEDVPFMEEKASKFENKRTAREILNVVEKIKNKKREAKFP